MKKILIIGASGYVGGRLSLLLAEKGYAVTALCFPEIPKDTYWVSAMDSVLCGDITKENVVDSLTNSYFDVVIHLVSLDHNDSNKLPNYVSSINVMPVWNLLDSFNKKNNLGRFIYFSTVHVYGLLPTISIEETFIPTPKTVYGLTHFMSENVCNYYNSSSNIECVSVRMTNSYGSPYFKENSCWWLVVNDFCKAAFYDNKITLLSDGSAIRDFVHYKDVFGAIDSIIMLNKVNENVFHLSSGKSYTILELAYTVKEEFKKRYGVDIPILLPETIAQHEAINDKYTIDNYRLKKIDFEISMKLENGINELFDYFETNE